MVEGYCTTNIDNFKHVKWPAVFAGCPHIGDEVQATEPAWINVIDRDSEKRIVNRRQIKIECPTLKVVGVTHYIDKHDHNIPKVRVELHSQYAYELGWM